MSRARYLEKVKQSNESLLDVKNRVISRRDTAVAVLGAKLEFAENSLVNETALRGFYENAYKSEKKRRRGRFWIFAGGVAVGIISGFVYD